MKTKPLRFLSIKAAQQHPAVHIVHTRAIFIYVINRWDLTQLCVWIWMQPMLDLYDEKTHAIKVRSFSKTQQTTGDISMMKIKKHSSFVKLPMYLQPKTNISPEKWCLVQINSCPFKMVCFLRGHLFILRGSCTFPKMFFSSDLLTIQMEVTKKNRKGSLGRVAGTCFFSQYTRAD